MAAVAHGWHPPGGGGPSVEVAREYNRADVQRKQAHMIRKEPSRGKR